MSDQLRTQIRCHDQRGGHSVDPQVRRFGGDTGHLFGCRTDRGRRLLPVGVPALPLTTLDMGPARQSRLISRVKVICRHIATTWQLWTNLESEQGEQWVGILTSIKGTFIQSSFLLPSIWCELDHLPNAAAKPLLGSSWKIGGRIICW